MSLFRKLALSGCLALLAIQASSQTSEIVSPPINIHSVIIDTIKTQMNSTTMNVLWLNDTITITVQKKEIVIDSTVVFALRKSSKDNTILSSKEDIEEFLEGRRIGAQNCYSYALEKYFDNHRAFNQDLFDSASKINRAPAEKILNNYFEKIAAFPTVPKKNLQKMDHVNDVLLAFLNQYGWATHFVYYRDGIFYSKNGAFKPIEFDSLGKFLKKHYWDTKQVLVYKINEDKVRKICSE